MEPGSDACREQVRRIQAALLRMGWHQRTGNPAAFLNTPINSTTNPSDPHTASQLLAMQSVQTRAVDQADGQTAEATSLPKSIVRAPHASGPLGVLGDCDVSRGSCECRTDCLTSAPTACGGAYRSTRFCLRALQRHEESPVRAEASPMNRTAEPHMFVRVVCDGEGVSTQESTDGLAPPSSESPTSLARGRMGGDDVWGDLIARAWGGAEVATMGRVGDAHDRCNTTTVPHSGAGCHWGRKGCDAPSDATPSCTAEVRHPEAPSDTGEIPSDVPALVSSMWSLAAAQPPPSSTRLHAGGRSNSCRTSRLRAPTTRIASLAGAGAASCCSARDAISVDALYTDIHPSVAASHALPSTPPPRHALAASRHQQRVLRAVKLLDAVLDDSSVGRSGGAATRRLDALHQILMTLTDACGQPPASLSRATGAELRRLRKRLVQEAVRGDEAPRMLRGSSTSSRMSARLPPPLTFHAAPHHGLEGDSEKDVRRAGTFRLESVADDVHCTKPCPSPAPDASSLSFASVHSDTPAPTAVAASWPVLPPPPPPGSSELDPYLQSTHQFQQEIASLHQAQLRRLPLR